MMRAPKDELCVALADLARIAAAYLLIQYTSQGKGAANPVLRIAEQLKESQRSEA